MNTGPSSSHNKAVFFSLQDESTLVWYSKDREKQLNLNSVSAVILGQKTVRNSFHPEKIVMLITPHITLLVVMTSEFYR
jgi:hypothetical protein